MLLLTVSVKNENRFWLEPQKGLLCSNQPTLIQGAQLIQESSIMRRLIS